MEGLKVEQAEALSSILDGLSECNKIQANNIQTLVSCPRPPHHPLPRPSMKYPHAPFSSCNRHARGRSTVFTLIAQNRAP